MPACFADKCTKLLNVWEGLLSSSSATTNIAPSTYSRLPEDVPLRNLSSSTRPPRNNTGSQNHSRTREAQSRLSASPSDTAGSDFSDWDDTGDLAEQLFDAEDPLRDQLRGADRELADSFGKPRRREKKPKYQLQVDDYGEKYSKTGFAIEDIKVPEPAPRHISKFEHKLAAMMNGGERQMHGLTGHALILFTSVFVSLGVFLFGYDQGVMSGIITGPYFKKYFNDPSPAEIGMMVAILEVGAFISSLAVGRIGDIIGRRKTILYGSIIFFIGGLLQTIATDMGMMMAGRIIAGFGVGMLSTIVPVYQSEISPPHNRGKLACIEFTGNIVGYTTSVWVDYGCSYIESDYSWRTPLLMQCIMGALLGIGSLVIVESPRWLLDNDHDEEGIVVIANLYGGGDIHNDKAKDEYREIKMGVLIHRQEGERSYAEMFRRYGTRVLIAMSAQAFAQLNGINVISYYAPLVFESAGWVGRDAILMTGINGITYFLSTIPPWYLVDRLGRRPILLSGAIMMCLSLSAISYFLYIDVSYTPVLVVVFVMIYNAAFGYSWGPIPWLYPPEILPLSIRSKGASLSTATNWAFNWLVGIMTPVLQDLIHWRLYLIHAFFCAVSFVFVYFVYPETRGVRLEDMNRLFNDAPSAMNTPQTAGEASSLIRSESPVPSLDLRRGRTDSPHFGVGSPSNLSVDPPHVHIKNGRPHYSRQRERDSSQGSAGFFSRVSSALRGEASPARDPRYRSVGQQED